MRRNLISGPLPEEPTGLARDGTRPRIMSNPLRPPGTAHGVAACQPERVDWARSAPDFAQAGFHRLCGHRPSDPRGLERLVPPRKARGKRGGVRAARAMGGSLGVALARDAHETLAVEEQVLAGLRVAARHDDGPRSE